MHYIVFVEDFERLQYLFQVKKSLSLLKFALLFHNSIEGATIAELVNKVEIVNCFEHIDVSDNVRTVLYTGEYVYFVDCALLQFRDLLKFLGWNDFDGNFLLVFYIDCFKNFGVDSLAQLLQD
jgi:hypothetical protein